MMVDVSTDIVIDRPPSAVSTYAADPDNVPSWYVNIKSVEWRTAPVVSVGSRIAFVAHFLGRRMAYTYEIVEFVAGERLVMRTTDGPFPMETTYIWQSDANGGTRMTLRNRGTPTGFSAWVAPFMAMAMRRANRKDLVLLKRLLEHRDAGPQ
jgi:uncharacterized protein YndB with AHSA1/START domain